MTAARLRQVALVARDLDAACASIERELGLRDPFRDPGVAEFGLTNAVYEAGDTFLEVVSPAREGTTAGRYLERRGGDAGYMVLFQVDDTPATRARAGELGVRIVWNLDLDDISGTHLHPQDLKGAIVSFDSPRRPASWRWGGPRWVDGPPADARATPAIAGVEVGAVDPDDVERRWTALFGPLPHVRFTPVAAASDEGIRTVELTGFDGEARICGVTFRPAGAEHE